LYTFVIDRLTTASFKQDPRPVDEAIRVVTILREGWIGIAQSGQNANPAKEPPNRP
jgi:flagellin-specific chaperone FliS